MSFVKNLLNSVWQNVAAEKMFFIKTVITNAFVCALFLVIPSFVRSFIGALFAKASESTLGIYAFLKENMARIESIISSLTALLLVMVFIVAILTTFSIMEKDINTYKIYKRAGMSDRMIMCHSFVQNALVCICWCVLSLFVARIIAAVISNWIEADILMSLMHFLIMLSAEAILVILMSFVKIKMSLSDPKIES